MNASISGANAYKTLLGSHTTWREAAFHGGAAVAELAATSYLDHLEEIKAIRYATFRDAFSGGFINVFLITEDGWERVFREDVAALKQSDA